MSQEERINTCCVIECPNTTSDCNVEFYSFPLVISRTQTFSQRDQWVQAITSQNGESWRLEAHSLVCSKHFVNGRPSSDCRDADFVPSVFDNKKEGVIKARAVSIKKFALEYIKYDALLEKPNKSNVNTDKRRFAYVLLAKTLGIPVRTARAWERRFRHYIEEKTAGTSPGNRKPAADGSPHWLTAVEERLYANPLHRLASPGGAASARRVVAALCAAARAHGALCSTALYNDVRRTLRLPGAVNDLHAVWVSTQRVSLAQTLAAARGGDAAPPPRAAAAVADLLLLHTDVSAHRLVTDESVTLYEEAAALHALWQLVQRHRLELAAPERSRVRAQRWSRAHRDYLASGRTASLVVLQRRWHELKLQARERLAAHWRRPRAAPGPAPALGPAPAPPLPLPAPLHIAILKRYPHIATGTFDSWRQLVLSGAIVTEPLEEESDAQDDDSKKAPEEAAEHRHADLPGVEEPIAKQEAVEEKIDVKQTQGFEIKQPTDTNESCPASVAEQLYPNLSKVEEPVEQQTTDSKPVTEKPAVKLEVEHNGGGDLLVEQSAVDDPVAERLPSDAVRTHVSDPLSEHTLRVKDEAVTSKCANTSDIDTDVEDNLVIDERSNNIPCSLKQESVTHTETHSAESVSPPAPLGNIVEVLQMIDPSTVKTEILFESDEDDFQPCNVDVKDEIETKEKASFISDRIMFADEEPEPGGSRDITSPDDVTERMFWESEMDVDDFIDDTPHIDNKLLMDTYVRLIRIDETRSWKNSVRKDNSIRVSRIRKSLYTVKRINTNTPRSIIANTQEIKVDKSSLDKIAKTHSIRQLCANIKRELMEEQLQVLEGNASSKQETAHWESDDDHPLVALREASPSETTLLVEREMAELSSSGEEPVGAGVRSKRREDKRRRGAHHAASTIEWSAAFTPAYGRARRVRLPDIEQVRRHQRAASVAQVAPISAMGAGELVTQPGDAPAACRALDLPPEHQLQAALDELTTLSTAEQVLERAYCCLARRQRDVNDARRRIGLPERQLHNHPDGVCRCCCARASEAHARRRLDRQLRALHADIERMLRKASRNPDSPPEPEHSRPARPARAAPHAATAAERAQGTPANAATDAKASKAKPAASNNRSKKRRHRAKALAAPSSPTPAPEPAPANDYEEWQRQKTMNAQYFYINSLPVSSKKTKRSTAQDNAPAQNILRSCLLSDTRQSSVVVASEETPAQSVAASDMPAGLQPSPSEAPAGLLAAQLATPVRVFASPPTSTELVLASQPIQPVRVFASQPTPSEQMISSQPTPTEQVIASQLIQPVRVFASQPTPTEQGIASQPTPPELVVSQLVTPVRVFASQSALATARADTPARPVQWRSCLKSSQTDNPAIRQALQTNRAIAPRRTKLTEEQVAQIASIPAAADSEPKDKPLSILEEYSRTLGTAPVPSSPSVSALQLQVPGPQGPETTIVMALTLPAKNIINRTVNCLYVNASPQENAPLIQLVRMPNELNPNKRASKPRTTRHKRPKLMSLCNSLRDGDVIEIIDSDSEHSTGSGGRTTNSNNTSADISQSSDLTANTNNSSTTVTCSNTSNTDEICDLTASTPTQAGDTINTTPAAQNKNKNNEENSKPGETNSKPAARPVNKGKTSNRAKCRQMIHKPKVTSDVELVSSNSMSRPCSVIPELRALTDGRARCAACRPDAGAMPDFMRALRAGAAADGDDLYWHKEAATELPVSELPCGGTLLCVDAARPPLTLSGGRVALTRDRPSARDHLVLTDADVPCTLPTYWTLTSYKSMSRIVPDDTSDADVADAEQRSGASPSASGGRASSSEDRKVCQKRHKFKILTALCSAAAVREAAASGSALLLLSVARARVLVLSVTRARAGQAARRYRAQAAAAPELLQELESLLDEAETDEQPGGSGDAGAD